MPPRLLLFRLAVAQRIFFREKKNHQRRRFKKCCVLIKKKGKRRITRYNLLGIALLVSSDFAIVRLMGPLATRLLSALQEEQKVAHVLETTCVTS